MRILPKAALRLFSVWAGVWLFLLGSSSSPAADTYYVSPQGNDQAAGTEAAPWKTLRRATTNLRAGSTLVLRAGAYDGPVTIHEPDVTIQSYQGEQARIQTRVDSEKKGH